MQITVKSLCLRGAIFLLVGWGVISLAGVGMEWLAMRYDSFEIVLNGIFESDRNYDVIYFGNSVTSQSINPEVIDKYLGTRGYNMSLGGANFLTNELCLREYLARGNRPPRLAVIGIYLNRPKEAPHIRNTLWRYFSPEVTEVASAEIRRGGGEPPKWFDRWAHQHVPLYAYRNVLPIVARISVRGKAFIPRMVAGHLAYTGSYGNMNEKISPLQGGVDWESLRHLIEYCRGLGIEVVLFEPPNWSTSNTATTNRPELLQQIERFAADEGVPWISMNTPEIIEQFPVGDWVNSDHMNATGAEKLSRLLAPVVASRLERGKERLTHAF